MKWHKVEDYPVGSDEYVLISTIVVGQREDLGCFVAVLRNGYWYDGLATSPVQPTDRWCHIDLPEN